MQRAEYFTAQFYHWEQRGRGWLLANEPVELEPPFVPFFYHATTAEYVDDGKRPTLLSMLADAFGKKADAPAARPLPHTLPVEPFAYTSTEDIIALEIIVPKESKSLVAQMEQLLVMLSFCRSPLSFEIIATGNSLKLQIVCRESELQYINGQFKAFLPECRLSETPVGVDAIFAWPDAQTYIVDFGLAEEFMRPLQFGFKAEHDPFIALFGLLHCLHDMEHIAIQILFSGTVNPWAKSMQAVVSDNGKGSFFTDAPEMPALTKDKTSSPLFAVTIRLITQSYSQKRGAELLQQAAYALQNSSQSVFNKIVPLESPEYLFETRVDDVLFRESHRLGMLLNVKELCNFIHLPSLSVPTRNLSNYGAKSKSAPIANPSGGLILGVNEHEGKTIDVAISASQRLRHMHIIGATGTGKSTLLTSLISQDIHTGNGCTVLDPHGDLIEAILDIIPVKRIKDVVLIDPSDARYPVGFNMLSAKSEIEHELLASDIVAVFRRLSTSWGDQMNTVLSNAILAFTESSRGGTLFDLRRFLLEKEFRNAFLETIDDENILYYWQKEFPILKSNSIGPILTRLDSFLRPKLIRNMISQQKSVDFNEIINGSKILLVKLSQGLIGADNSYLLGTFIVSKLQQAAIARQTIEQQQRNPHYLYIDEFHHFSTPSMTQMLSGVRKYGLGLILAHQDMQQIEHADRELTAALQTNAGTRICFRMSETDAKKFQEGFSFFTAADLQNLTTGEAIARIERPDQDFNLRVQPYKNDSQSESYKTQIIEYSRRTYATFLDELPKEIKQTQEVVIEKKSEEELLSNVVTNKVEKREELAVPKEVQVDTVKNETQHRYLQNLIKRMAESKGYTATLEAPIASGNGFVDVVLTQDGRRIACEISVSTEVQWEYHNLLKCLGENFQEIIMCVTEKRTAQLLKDKIESEINSSRRGVIKVFSPDELFQYLDITIKPEQAKETRIKGYRVKVSYDQVSANEVKQKQASIVKVIQRSLKKNIQ